jgi:group I intron endonuclease
MIGIYKITSPTKKIYIGQSIDIEKRFNNYGFLNCKRQPAIYNSLKKYGVKKHKFEILCECNIDELNDKERYYQDLYSVISKNGLNCSLTSSTYRSGKHSEESKLKMSVAKKGNKNCLGHKNMLGKKHTEESKKKMSESTKGYKHSSESIKKMSEIRKGIKLTDTHRLSLNKIILNTENGIFYIGGKEAAESVNIKYKTLLNQLSGHRKNKTNLIYV